MAQPYWIRARIIISIQIHHHHRPPHERLPIFFLRPLFDALSQRSKRAARRHHTYVGDVLLQRSRHGEVEGQRDRRFFLPPSIDPIQTINPLCPKIQ